MLQTVRVSVGQTWRFVTEQGSATTVFDQAGYKGLLNELKDGLSPYPFGLPWTPYRSKLWERFFGWPYANTDSRVLVAALLPLTFEKEMDFSAPEFQPKARFEVLLHPFAVSTVVHLNLFAVEPWPPEQEVAAVLSGFFQRPLLPPEGQVRDGIPLSQVPSLPGQDFLDNDARFEPTGTFVLLSALHQEAPDPTALAYRLASRFTKTATDEGRPMNTENSAIATTDGNVGLLLARAQDNAGVKLRCLHQNTATLLAYIQNLSTLMSVMPSVPAAWFQRRAALILNHLYRRVPLRGVPYPPKGVYKSRLVELWIDYFDLKNAINEITPNEAHPPPTLPV